MTIEMRTLRSHELSFMYILYTTKDSSPKKAKLHDTLMDLILDKPHCETVRIIKKRDRRSHRHVLDQGKNIFEDISLCLKYGSVRHGRLAA